MAIEVFKGHSDNIIMNATQVENSMDFSIAREKELKGLFAQGVFTVCDESEVPPGARMYGTRFVDTIKQKEDGSRILKSCLVAQNYRDKQAVHIPTISPTVSGMGQRIALTLMALDDTKAAYMRDVQQAYVQSKSALERSVYFHPVPEMNVPGKVLRGNKVLYGMPKAGLLWSITFEAHHKKNLEMQQSTADKCLFFKHESENKDEVPNISVIQVDDTLDLGSEKFLIVEEDQSQAFRCKPRNTFEVGSSFLFNGFWLTKGKDEFFIDQHDKLAALALPQTKDEAVSFLARLQYVA